MLNCCHNYVFWKVVLILTGHPSHIYVAIVQMNLRRRICHVLEMSPGTQFAPRLQDLVAF